MSEAQALLGPTQITALLIDARGHSH